MQEIVVKVVVPVVVAHAVVLAVMLAVIRKMLLGDTNRAIARVRDVEAEVRKKEEAIRREIEEHEKEFARKKAEAEEALRRQKEEGEKELARARDQVLSEARKEADRIIDQARKNEEKYRKQLAQEMEEKMVEYAMQLFGMVFSEKMDAALNEKFIDELLDALAEVDSSSITVDARSAQFTSSHPLSVGQKERLQKLLAEKFNAQISIDETVRQDLIAGLILKLGGLEIDGSLRNRLQEAAAELKKSVGM
mgnify:CR=1 FL=1